MSWRIGSNEQDLLTELIGKNEKQSENKVFLLFVGSFLWSLSSSPHFLFLFTFFFLLLVFSFLTPLPALLPVLNLHLVFLSHQSLSHQCPCTNVYRETSWNTHFKQDRHNVVPKAKPVYPAASGSSSSSLICDSLQRSIYQSLQQFMCLFFFLAVVGTGRKSSNGGRRQENPRTSFFISVVTGSSTSLIMLHWTQLLSQVLWGTDHTEILLLPKSFSVALHDYITCPIFAINLSFFFYKKEFVSFACTCWLVKKWFRRERRAIFEIGSWKKYINTYIYKQTKILPVSISDCI